MGYCERISGSILFSTIAGCLIGAGLVWLAIAQRGTQLLLIDQQPQFLTYDLIPGYALIVFGMISALCAIIILNPFQNTSAR